MVIFILFTRSPPFRCIALCCHPPAFSGIVIEKEVIHLDTKFSYAEVKFLHGLVDNYIKSLRSVISETEDPSELSELTSALSKSRDLRKKLGLALGSLESKG